MRLGQSTQAANPITTRRATPRFAVAVIAIALAGGSLVMASPAAATRSSHKQPAAHSGKKLHYCYGKVRRVRDGDTVDVKLSDPCLGHAKGSVVVVRNAGIQATETHTHECWSGPARSYMARLAPVGHKVRISAYGNTLTKRQTPKGQSRSLMFLDAARPASQGGPWVDVQAALLSAGLAMDKRQLVENTHDARYAILMQRAMHQHIGMWGDPHHCGHDYAPNAHLESWIGWKTNGADDAARANEEWFRVRNTGSTPVNLSHWKVRDGSHSFGGQTRTYFTFPSGTVLRPGRTATLHPGYGSQDVHSMQFHNDNPDLPFYRNADMPSSMSYGGRVSSSHAAPGAETILVDPAKNFRSWAVYPCVVACHAPMLKILHIQPRTTQERIVVRNTASHGESLTGVVLDYDGLTKEFNPSTWLNSGARLVVHVGHTGHDTNHKAYWPHTGGHMLSDHGGKVWLRTADDVTIALKAWGNGGHYRY